MIAEDRAFVHARALGCCEYCQSPHDFTPDDFSIEHIFPAIKGGTDDRENLALSCQGCNSRKFTATHATDPLMGSVVPLYHPRTDTWQQHFIWSDDLQEIIGITPTGRATVERIQLNRPNVRNLRRALVALGEHPATLPALHSRYLI